MRRMSFIELAPLPSAVPCARLHAVHVLRDWNLRDLADDTALVVSELVTNAVTASAVLPDRPPVSLRLSSDGRCLRIEVQDHSPLDLRLDAEASDDAEHGRGLGVVAALSTRCGTERTGPHRKTVWSELRIRPHETSYLGVNVDPCRSLKPKTESSILKQAGLRKDRP
jgi:anti-sigma regulatory factor (Ser/Thr protein kinase)